MKRNLKISYEIKIACEENVPEQLEHLLEISKKKNLGFLGILKTNKGLCDIIIP